MYQNTPDYKMSCYFCPKVRSILYFLFKILNIFTLQHTLYVKKALMLTFNTGFRIQPFVNLLNFATKKTAENADIKISDM